MSCAVPFADVLQYAGASSVEVTGGPKLLRHIKPGRCVQNIRTITLPLTQIPNHHPITTQSPPNHHPITTQSPPNHHRITTELPPNHHRSTTESPPNHHRITDHRNPPPPRQVRRERPIRKVHPPRRHRPRRFRHGQHHPVLQEVSLRGPVAPRRAHGRAHARTRALQVRPLFCTFEGTFEGTLVLLVSAEGSASFVYSIQIYNSNLIFRSRHVGDSCVANSLPNTENARNLDATPDVFDNTYWKHVTRAECPKRRKHADRYDRCTAPYLTGESPFYVL